MSSQRTDSSKARGRAKSASRTKTGLQLEALVLEILGAFFDLRSVGQKQGMVNQSGAGTWGLMRILKEDGPKTVPEVARMRSVSRQYIQKLANELIADGLIEMIDNPQHRRSKLMTLTRQGDARLNALTDRFRGFLEIRAREFQPRDLGMATQTIRQLRKSLAGEPDDE